MSSAVAFWRMRAWSQREFGCRAQECLVDGGFCCDSRVLETQSHVLVLGGPHRLQSGKSVVRVASSSSVLPPGCYVRHAE